MVALRRFAVGLAVLFGTVAGPAPAPTATPWSAASVQVVIPDYLFQRANRFEIRTPLHHAETQKVLATSDIQPVKAGPLLHDLPAPKPKHKYNPFTDAPHTQAGAEQFAAALPWPWPGIVRCESLRDQSWRVSAKSWARGLFQFLPSTWHSLGGAGDPAAASWREQYRMAVKLRLRDGLRHSWVCARMLGYS